MSYIIYTSSVHAMHYYNHYHYYHQRNYHYHHRQHCDHHHLSSSSSSSSSSSQSFSSLLCVSHEQSHPINHLHSAAPICMYISGDSHSSVADSFYSIAGVHRSQGTMSSFGCRMAHLGANYTDADRIDNDCNN